MPFTILLPGKPDTFTQPVVLNGAPVAMTMTATEVDDVTFAVGTASFPDAASAQNALVQMKTALIKNIDGRPVDTAIPSPGKAITDLPSLHVLTLNASGSAGGKPLQMTGRLYNSENRVYQVIMVGDPKKMRDEVSEMFFTSFKPN